MGYKHIRIVGIVNNKTFVAKEILKFTFTDFSKNYVEMLLTPRRPKNKMVAMDLN